MPKFRKKPIIIEAVQFNPHLHPEDAWPEGVISWKTAGYQPRDGSWGYIQTLEGKMHVMAGDWIIKGVVNELYPCKESVFAQTYERVEE